MHSHLVEGPFQLGLLPAAGMQIEHATCPGQTPDGNHARQRTRQGIEDLVNDNRIQFVGELAGGTIPFVVGDVPPEVECPLRVRALNGNRHAPALGEGMNREAREHGLGPQDTEGWRCSLLGVAWCE